MSDIIMIGERLRELRNRRKYSQQELADKIGITRSTYSGYENNYAQPDVYTLIKLAEFHKVPTDYILLGTNDNFYIPEDFISILTVLDPADSKMFWTHLLEYAKYLSKK